jgi:hypothetical protein
VEAAGGVSLPLTADPVPGAKRNVPEHSCALVVYEKRNAQAKNELRAL